MAKFFIEHPVLANVLAIVLVPEAAVTVSPAKALVTVSGIEALPSL